MDKKTRILLAGVFVLSLFLAPAMAQEEQAVVAAEPYSWDFGRVKEGQKLEHEFVFKNQGPKVLNIKEMNTSCGCTVSTVKKKQLAPGEETRISVKFNAKGYRGPVKQFVYVHTDDIENPVVRLAIKADVDDGRRTTK